MNIPPPSPLARHWSLDPNVVFLNHGSFGACPTSVLMRQRELQMRIEAEPVRFMVEELDELLDASRAELARFVNAKPSDLAFVTNATVGVNAVVRSLDFKPGDEILMTDQEYNACANAVRYVAERAGAKVVIAPVPFPVGSPREIVDAVLRGLTSKTKLVMLCHITSPTAIIFPIEALVREIQAKGVDVLIDGAHGPGMVPVDLTALNAAYYTANCHKWMCSPKGAGFLHVRADRQHLIRPTTISHGANSTRTDRSRFHLEFDWIGTQDFTPYILVGESIRAMSAMAPGGWPEIIRTNHERALRARDMLCKVLSVQPPAPTEMIGSIASVALPAGMGEQPTRAQTRYHDPLQDRLLREHRVQVPIFPWPKWPTRWIRVSAQLYNSDEQYAHLAAALRAVL